MRKTFNYILGIFIVLGFIGLFTSMAIYMAHQAYLEQTTIIAEGIVEGMYIDVEGTLFSTKTSYFIIIDAKVVEVSETAYNMVQIGDLIRVFADKHAVVL